MKFSIATLAAFTCVVIANPTPPPPVVQVAGFDEFVASPEPPLNTIPTPYRNLSYPRFSFSSGAGLIPGVKPRSLKNYISTGPVKRLTGQRSSFSVSGTTTKSFDLLQLYYGCILATFQDQAQLATPCKFIVTGYKKGTRTKVGPVSFEFEPDSLTAAEMNLGTFSQAFGGIEEALVELVITDTLDADTAILLDDIKYKAYF